MRSDTSVLMMSDDDDVNGTVGSSTVSFGLRATTRFRRGFSVKREKEKEIFLFYVNFEGNKAVPIGLSTLMC
jgi:hypothetical protein